MDDLLFLRKLELVDFPVVKEIYDYYILNTTATWHTEPISIAELQSSIYVDHHRYKSFLVYHLDLVIGYCYFSEFKKRQAYFRSAEVTLYLKHDFTHQGFGAIILHKMEQQAKLVNLHTLVANISGDNVGSIKLFERCGYTKCGHLKNMGEKYGQILDIVCYQIEI